MRTPRRAGLGRTRRGGFTLVEVLTALIIFAVAIIAFIQSMGVSVSIQSDLVSEQRAAMLTENILEEIKTVGALEVGEEYGQFEGVDAAFQWRTVIVETDIEFLMEVNAAVSWNGGHGMRDYILTTRMLQPAQ